MKWTDEHDILLVREILTEEPYTHRPKSKERGAVWAVIAAILNSLSDPVFHVTQRSVRDRFKLLETKFNVKRRYEERATGISPEESEIDKALEEILAKMAEAEGEYDIKTQDKKDKMEKEKGAAEEMRRRSLETFAETKKRSNNESDVEDNEPSGKKKRVRSTGSETLIYLQENAQMMKSTKEKELLLKEKELELHSQQQNAMMHIMQRQIEAQQQSHEQQQVGQQQLQAAILHQQSQQTQQMNQFMLLMQKMCERK